MADDLLDIADNSETEPGKVARDRLRTDNRRWLLSKALPKVYGDKVAIGGDPDAPPVKLTGITIEFVELGTSNRKSLPPPDDGTGGSSV